MTVQNHNMAPPGLLPWATLALVTAAAALLLQMFGVLYRDLSGHASVFHLTFHRIWLIAAGIGVVYSVRRLGIDAGVFLVVTLIGGSAVSMPLLLIPGSWRPLPSYYQGVESRLTDETYETGIDERLEYVHSLDSGSLHANSCPYLRRDLPQAALSNEHVGLRGFMTWQRGVAEGFSPHSCITSYRYPKDFTGWLAIIFSIGPLTILEAGVTGLLTTFPLMLLGQYIWRRYSGQDVWARVGSIQW